MEMLRNALYSIKGKWLLSCDGSDICREIFADFAKIEVPFKYSAGTGGRIRPVKSEMLVACDALAGALQGNLTRVCCRKPSRPDGSFASQNLIRAPLEFKAVSGGKVWREAA